MGLLSNSLSGGLMSGVENDLREMCPDLGTIYRPVKTQGAIGGTNYNVSVSAATVIVRNIPVNIQNTSISEIQTFARRGLKVSNRLYFPTGVALLLGDFMPNPSNASQTYVIVHISDMGGEHVAFETYANLIL